MARRMIRFRKRFSARRSQGTMVQTSPDQTAVRAKSRRHKKSTADKWNQ